MRSRFEGYYLNRRPQPGDLLRNEDTSSYINIVLSVSDVHEDKHPQWRGLSKFVYVRSVRYCKIINEEIIYLLGKRSRSFKYWLKGCKWHAVKEVQIIDVDNSERRKAILKAMEGIDTTYQGNKSDDS